MIFMNYAAELRGNVHMDLPAFMINVWQFVRVFDTQRHVVFDLWYVLQYT